MVDAMNAEVSLGTISTVPEAIEWLGYTYLFVRMKRNPFLYGMAHDETQEDPQLGSKREGLTRTAGRRLADIGMIRFDEVDNSLTITDLGRIAAKYYLRHETVEIFST
jgi:antiviral helicase SLH1